MHRLINFRAVTLCSLTLIVPLVYLDQILMGFECLILGTTEGETGDADVSECNFYKERPNIPITKFISASISTRGMDFDFIISSTEQSDMCNTKCRNAIFLIFLMYLYSDGKKLQQKLYGHC